ncbi:hypothetical protein BDQ17DRAFT_1544282 [Cyathus striatus]|nr:hypothetical protein BDQ17DRAFT_1544282 [Cyathus striatus]
MTSESSNRPNGIAPKKLHDSNIPNPSHRHGAPSAPWPWMDIDDTVDSEQLKTKLPPVPDYCDHLTCDGDCWKKYPKSRFPNWTDKQVKKSGIEQAINDYDKTKPCVIHHVDVNDEGLFANPGSLETKNHDAGGTWKTVMERKLPSNLRVRALFIENLSGPVLRILGAKYNIEPFFFSSSLNWIPSRYQEDVKPGECDHITISVTFLRSIVSENQTKIAESSKDALASQMINTNAPLNITTANVKRQLIMDFLSVHLIRKKEGSVIISYHPSIKDVKTTTAKYLQERIRFAGQSVYWQNIFRGSTDPTFVLLTFIWHTMYSWDEALEHLYVHICKLETEAITETEKLNYVTQQLHTIRANLLHYASLLRNLQKTVEFIRDTHYPALDAPDVSEDQRKFSKSIMERECKNLLSEVSRLEELRTMQAKRLKNVMGLVFNTVNIDDSGRMRQMTEAAVRDSAGMKQIAYLTMIFLPASYIATVFGMNVKEITDDARATLGHYISAAIPMTIATVWIIIAFHSKHVVEKPFWQRLGWPYLLLKMRYWDKSSSGNMLGHNAV